MNLSSLIKYDGLSHTVLAMVLGLSRCWGQSDLCTLRILPLFVTEFNPKYGNTDLLIWLRKRSSPKYGNGHHLNIFLTVISCVKNVAPSVGNVHVPLYYARCQATRNIP